MVCVNPEDLATAELAARASLLGAMDRSTTGVEVQQKEGSTYVAMDAEVADQRRAGGV